MSTLEQLHNAYMASRNDDDNFNFDDDYEAKKINEYYAYESEEIHWKPVARIPDAEKLIAMKRFNQGR